MTIGTRPVERVGRAPIQMLAEIRFEEQSAAEAVAQRALQLEACRAELGRAAERRDRLAVYRFSDLQAALITSLARDAVALRALLRENTPALTGERPQ